VRPLIALIARFTMRGVHGVSGHSSAQPESRLVDGVKATTVRSKRVTFEREHGR
jgi:hypothetical protein